MIKLKYELNVVWEISDEGMINLEETRRKVEKILWNASASITNASGNSGVSIKGLQINQNESHRVDLV